MSSASEEEKKVEEEVKGGELLFCGATCWDIVGRRKGSVDGNLVSPSRLRPLVGIDIRFVASGCGKFHFFVLFCFIFTFLQFNVRNRCFYVWVCDYVNAASCHCVALDIEGRCYTWGRNEV